MCKMIGNSKHVGHVMVREPHHYKMCSPEEIKNVALWELERLKGLGMV